jgi:hypothetical protein
MVIPQHDKLELENAVALTGALLINEVVEGWGKHRNTVVMSILKDKLVARQAAGNIWIISRASVVALWGPPISEPVKDMRE